MIVCSRRDEWPIPGVVLVTLLAVGLGVYGGIHWQDHSVGVGALAWSCFLAYCVADQYMQKLFPERPSQSADDTDVMFDFSRLTDTFCDWLPLTSHRMSSKISVYVSFTTTILKNVLNIVFLTATIITLPHYDRTIPNTFGRHVLAWLEVPLVYIYVVAWLLPFLLITNQQLCLGGRSQDNKEFGMAVRVTAQWFTWLGRMSALNLLRNLHPTDLHIRMREMSKRRLVRTALVILGCSVCGLIALRIKIADVNFLVTDHLFSFTWIQWVKVAGFVNNIFGMFNLRTMRIASKIQAHQLHVKDWLTALADYLATRHSPLGAFMRMVALQPMHVNILLMELRKSKEWEHLKKAFVEDQQKLFEEQLSDPTRNLEAYADTADPSLPPPLYSFIAEVFEARRAIRDQRRQRFLS